MLANWYSVLIQSLLGDRILLDESKRAFYLFYKADCWRFLTKKQNPFIKFQEHSRELVFAQLLILNRAIGNLIDNEMLRDIEVGRLSLRVNRVLMQNNCLVFRDGSECLRKIAQVVINLCKLMVHVPLVNVDICLGEAGLANFCEKLSLSFQPI